VDGLGGLGFCAHQDEGLRDAPLHVHPGDFAEEPIQRLAATVEGGAVVGFVEGFELEHFTS
jgi:hypothetical protein